MGGQDGRGAGISEEAMREAHLPAQHQAAEAEARVPGPDADARGSRGDPGQAAEGPHPVERLITVRDRATFQRFPAGRRRRSGVLTVTKVVDPSPDAPRVALRVGKRVGNAVTRNRVRRRLRAGLLAHRDLLEAGHAYLVSAAPEAADASYASLEESLVRSLAGLRTGSSGAGPPVPGGRST